MAQLILGVIVFALAAAVIGLFAKLGDLASQVREPTDDLPSPDTPPQPLPQAKLGAEADQWPAELADLPRQPLAHVVVFGVTCNSCHRIASGATGSLDALTPRPAIVISCPTAQRGADFVATYSMVASHPHAIDVGGEWLRGNFGVGTSPTILVFEYGKLRSAHTFTTVPMLLNLPPTALEEAHPHAEAGVSTS